MWNNQKQQKLLSLMSNLQTYYHFKLDFQTVDQHTGDECLIHGTKRRKDNQLQSNNISVYTTAFFVARVTCLLTWINFNSSVDKLSHPL